MTPVFHIQLAIPVLSNASFYSHLMLTSYESPTRKSCILSSVGLCCQQCGDYPSYSPHKSCATIWTNLTFHLFLEVFHNHSISIYLSHSFKLTKQGLESPFEKIDGTNEQINEWIICLYHCPHCLTLLIISCISLFSYKLYILWHAVLEKLTLLILTACISIFNEMTSLKAKQRRNMFYMWNSPV